MNAFFRKFFGKPAKDDSVPASMPSRSHHSSIHAGSESSVRAQLVQVVMRDLLRRSGIPPEWIVCEPQVLNSRSRGQGIFVRLAVKHWDDRLMQYAFAFQKALLTDIVRFEPQAAKWLHGIAWQLEVAASCPHTELPNMAFWSAPPAAKANPPPAPRQLLAAQAATAVPILVPQQAYDATAPHAVYKTPKPALVPAKATAQDEAEQDLERFFAVRDKELAEHSAHSPLLASYESTEPAPLQSR